MRNTSLGPRHLIDYCIDAAPTIEPTVPDRVLASDITRGITCCGKNGYEFTVGNVDHNYADISDGNGKLELPSDMVADMLQGCLDRGERVDWPDGSPGCRFRKAEPELPTLLEVRQVKTGETEDPVGTINELTPCTFCGGRLIQEVHYSPGYGRWEPSHEWGKACHVDSEGKPTGCIPNLRLRIEKLEAAIEREKAKQGEK